jgi:hypothetical protein
MDLARGELEYDRQTRLIDENVDLGGQPAARPMHRPSDSSPVEYVVPDADIPLADEAIVAGGRGSVALRDVRPRRAGAQSPVDAVQHHAIVAARHAPAAPLGAPLIVFKPDRALGKAAPFKRNDAMLGIMPIGVIAFPGSGISANLVDKARKVGVAGASTAAVLNRFCPLLYRIDGTAMSDRVKPGMTVNRV